MKKTMTMLLILCLLFSMMPATALAAEGETASGTCGNQVSWVLSEDGQLTISGQGAMDNYNIPESVPWYPYRDRIYTAWVQKGVTSLSDYAFYGCDQLCDITLADSLERIGAAALADTALTFVALPPSVTELGAELFTGCDALTYIAVDQANPAFSNDNSGVLFDKDKTRLIACPGAFEGAYEIPDTVAAVDEKAFAHCGKLTAVTIPGSVKVLHRFAFALCTALETVHLREGLETLENEVFMNCTALAGIIDIPASLKHMGSSFFQCTALSGIRFQGDMPEFEEGAFGGTELTVYYPADNPTWTKEKIDACKGLSKFVAYKPREEIAYGTIDDNISWVITLDGTLIVSGTGDVTRISDPTQYPWYSHAEQIRKVIFETGVTNVPEGAFTSCYPNLASAELKSVEIIDYSAFNSCTALKNVILPDTLKEIRNSAFAFTALESVNLPEGLTGIGITAFTETKLKELVLPEGLLSIGDGAFSRCAELKSAYLPDSIESAGMHLFGGCTALEIANIPANLDYVPDMMFDGCSSLKEIEIPYGISIIGMTNFRGTALTTVTIPGSVTMLASPFMDCLQLKEIIFEGDAPAMYSGCFQNVTATAYYPAGNATWTDEVMLNYGGTITWVPYGESAEPTVKWSSISTSLGGNIAMNFYVELSENLVSDPDAYIQFTFAGRTIQVPLSEGKPSDKNGVTVYQFSCPITSKNMTDEITAQVYNGDGKVGEPKSMSVDTYCNWVIANFKDEKTVNLMKGMLNYGASAQKLFNYRTDALANATLAEEDKVFGAVDASAYKHTVTGTEDGIIAKSMTLLLDSETTVRVYFELTGDKTIDQYTFTVDGVEVTPTYKDGKYYIERPNISAHRLDDMHVFTCGGITVTYGGLSYVNQVMTYYTEGATFEMASALYAYSKAAEAYIG